MKKKPVMVTMKIDSSKYKIAKKFSKEIIYS